MDLRQLEYLIAVADHGSFTAAARALHVSQPSLSHGVGRLERELGVELFARVGRSVQVTSAGQEVIAAARLVRRDVADLVAVAAAATTLDRGTVDIATLPTLAVDPVAELIGTFRGTHPNVTVRLHEPESIVEVEHSVRSGRSELGFTDLTTGGTGLARVQLEQQEIVVVAPPGTELVDQPVSVTELAQLSLVATTPGTSTRRLLDRALARSGLEPRIAVEVHHREAIVPLVLAGAGSTLLPSRLAAEAARRGAVVRTVHPPITRRVGILHRRARLSPAAAALVALARARARRAGPLS